MTARTLKQAVAAAILAAVAIAAAACGTAQPGTADFNTKFSSLEQIESAGFGWPRTLTSPAGTITVQGPAQRILTLSAGHDELVLALLDNNTDALAGVGSSTPEFSNIGNLVADLQPVGKDVEQILALQPDIVILDRFTEPDFIQQLNGVGLTVFQTQDDDMDFNIPNLLLLGYLLGREQRAIELADDLRQRLSAVAESVPEQQVTAVMASKFFGQIWANGSGSTGGNILDAAGITNAAADVPGDNGFVTLEGIAALNPDIILITGGGQEFVDEILEHPALQPVPAVSSGRVHQVTALYYSTLSHWTVCGVEEAARIAYSQQFAALEVCPQSDNG